MKKTILLLLICAVLISSCSVLEESLNKRVILTLTALPSSTPGATSTPYPTYTFYPSITPTPTLLPAAAFVHLNVDQVIQAFMTANLPVGAYRPMGKEDYGAVPQMALQGICFFTSSNGTECDGYVLAYLDQTSLDKTRQFFIDLGGDSGYISVNTNILVRIRPGVEESLARSYEAALAGLQ